MRLKPGWVLTLLLPLLLLPIVPAAALAADSPRQRLLMDFGWRFQLKDPDDAGAIFDYPEPGWLDKTREQDVKAFNALAASRPDVVAANLGGDVSFVKPAFDDAAWRSLDLPHDWVVELPFNSRGNTSHGYKDIDPKKGTSVGWYRRSFDLPADDKDKSLNIEFDGVYRNSLVWLNGHCLGRFRSGYTPFHYGVNKFANFGGRNTLVVRVDASRTEGWFYEGGGIYRHVWLVKSDPVHVAHWGTYVTTAARVSAEGGAAAAVVTVQTEVRNDSSQDAQATVVSTILDADGKSVAESEPAAASVEAGKTNAITQTLNVPSARLWSIETPYLYKLVTTVRRGGTVADVYETPFGIRTIHFDADKGFFLNGKRVEVKGVCNHQDFAGVGAALPDRLEYFRVEKVKEMGANAWRTSHNPPNPEVLDACDKLGVLVMDENRRFDDTPDALGQLDAMVRRDRNHPSVIIWSIGNEEMDIQGGDYGARLATKLQDKVHALDPTRPATVAMNFAWGKGFSKVIDVQGGNYFHNGDNDYEKFHARFPTKPMIGTEEASTVTDRGEYAVDKSKAYLSAFDLKYPAWGSNPEQWWTYFQTHPYVAGSFVWTGFDYRGEPTPYGWPNINSHFGLMDMCGFPKDIYYYYSAWWSDKPILYVYPHWNWPGKEGREIEVWCYSNYPEVELLLNGKSLGKQTVPINSHLTWKVKYEPGTLEARAYKGGQVARTLVEETTGAAVAVKLGPDRTTIDADGEDVSVVTVSAADAKGRAVPTANNLVHFEVTGGRIIGVGNGDPSCHEADKADRRSLFNGLAQVIVQSTKQAGQITLTAKADGCEPATVKIEARQRAPRPTAP